MAFAAGGFGDARGPASAPGTPAAMVGVDNTLGKFAERCKVPAPVAQALANALGGDLDMEMEDFAFMNEKAVTNAIADLVIPDATTTELHRSQAMRLYRRAKVAGVEAGLPLEGIPLTSPSVPAPSGGGKQEEAPTLLKFASYLDQSSEATFPLLTPNEIRQHRDVYKELFGSEPPTAKRPTDEQLSALAARLKSGRVPFVDFAVFGPFDDHAAKLRKFSDQVFVGGVLTTRLLSGPQTFADWQSCFEIFKAAMIMLKAAKPGTLTAYEEGVKELWMAYDNWSIISQADLAMRSREWTIVKDEMAAENFPGFDSAMPWEKVIAMTAFGMVTGPRAHWWWLHVQGPLTGRGSAPTTLAKLEQKPSNISPVAPHERQVSGGGPKNKAKAKSSGQGRDVSKEYCYPWNDGKCSKGPCPYGRLHACRECGGNHKVTECPRKGGGKGRGGGAGSSSGPGGKQRKRKAGGKGGASTFKK